MATRHKVKVQPRNASEQLSGAINGTSELTKDDFFPGKFDPIG
jgi:hypothetical protein